MKKKIRKRFVYEGLGFPIILKNISIIKKHGEIIPDIDFNRLQKIVLLNLCHKNEPLTGNEIRFIRKFFEMTLTEFGKNFGCSHAAVMKWEKYGNRFAKIEPTTDVYIRLFVFSHLNRKNNAFKELYEHLDIMQLLKHRNQITHVILVIDVKEKLKMVS